MSVLILRSSGSAGGGYTPEANFGYSGTPGSGSFTITSSLSQFGTKPTAAKPLLRWDPADNTLAPHANSRTTSMPLDNSGNANPHFGTLATNVVRSGSSRSYEINPDLAGDPNPAVLDGLPISSTDLYCCLIYRTNFNASDAGAIDSLWNLKSHRWWDSSFAHDLKTGFGDDGVNDNMVLLFENTASPEQNHQVGSATDSTLPKNRWLVEEYEIHQGSLNTADAVVRVYHDGKLITTYTDISRTTGTYSNIFSLYHTHQFQNVPSGQGYKVYYDRFHLDDSYCQVYITDQATWDDSVTRELMPQITTSWSAGQIDFDQVLGPMDYHGKYVQVRKSDRSVIRHGRFNPS